MDLSRLREAARARRTGRPGDAASSPHHGRGEDTVVGRELSYEYLDSEGRPSTDSSDRHALPPFDGARFVETPQGRCVVVDQVFDAERHYGPARMREQVVQDDATLAIIGGWEADRAVIRALERRHVLFLDLETTGLSGGAGTVAFLVGCGFFEDGAFCTRQYFLTHFSGERALLQAVHELLGRASTLVTFNGKSFDVPVMETRWSFQRMSTPLGGVPHLDMLHLARRFWRTDDDGELQSCRLVTLERALLGVHRVGDVPGFEIPARYFDFVRHGRAEPLEAVMLHNRLDLLSLAVLTARVQRLVRDGSHASRDPREWLATATIYDGEGWAERAAALYRLAGESEMASVLVRTEAWRRLARLHRRHRRYLDAAAAWEEVLHVAPDGLAALEAREALAVHHEHRHHDLERAHLLASEALQATSSVLRRRAVTHRLDRLERKLAAQSLQEPRPYSLLD